MPVSMREVAATAGVSESTVSLVLSNKKGTRVALETQRRVRQVAKELDYRPNPFARSIARRRTNTIRLITSSHRNPFFVEIAGAVDVQVRKAGYKLTVDATMDERPKYGPGEEVGIWPVDGALIYAHDTQDMVKYLGGQANEVPVVYLGYQGADPVDAITTDLYHGGRMAAEHVVERGYRKIAYMAPENARPFADTDARMRAYKDVCRNAGLAEELIFFDGNALEYECIQSLNAGLRIAARPTGQRPDAILCFNDSIAAGLLHGVRRAGLRVPEDIAITGFDNSVMAHCLDIPLTTVDIPVEAMCKAGIDLLVSRISGDMETPGQRLALRPKLVIGRTT